MAARSRLRRGLRVTGLGLALGAFALPLSLLLLPRAAAQGHGTIVGRLVDHQSRGPVRGARLALLGTPGGFVSDSEGRFAQAGLKPGNYVLQARAIGYVAASWIVELGNGEVHDEVFELERLPVQLDPVLVERRPGYLEQWRQEFERRRASGRGYFITEQQIAHAAPRTLGDLFRNVPGVRMQCRGATAGCVVRMARSPQQCRPDFVVDGFPATNSTSLDMPTTGIIGIEIYRTLTETPLQFLRADNQCGTIVIWTKSGPG